MGVAETKSLSLIPYLYMAKQRLIENVLVPHKLLEKLDVPLTEATIGGQVYKALAVYRFPFTRPNEENLNGRIYPYALWDKVFASSPVTLSLVDHPEEGAGDPARVWAVLRNPGYNRDKSLAYVDCYIIDNELGRTALGVLQAGGDVGLSSSGFGDFEADGKTVDPESFELERYFDWVLEPSYSVFGTLDDVKTGMGEKVQSSGTGAAGKQKQENTEGYEMAIQSLQEKREFEASLRRIYDDIKGRPVKERLERGREALTFYEGTDVDACKADFEALVKEAEVEFEATFTKGEKADDVKREANEFAAQRDEARRKQKEFEQEVERLTKENAALIKELENKTGEMHEADEEVRAFSDAAHRMVTYSEYAELHDYAKRAARLYQETRDERNLLQFRVQELEQYIAKAKAKARQTAAMRRQREAMERQMYDEAAQRRHDIALSHRLAIEEASERRFMAGIKPDVLDYYNGLLRMGENVRPYRQEILTKKTYLEAQMCWLRHKRDMNEKAMLEAKPHIQGISKPLPAKSPSKPAQSTSYTSELALRSGEVPRRMDARQTGAKRHRRV